MHLFVNTTLSDTGKATLQRQLPPDITAVFKQDLPKADQQAGFQSAAFVLGNPPPAWFADELPNLTFWQLDSAGFDGYQAVRVGATLANMGDYFARPCAETMLAGILAFYRRIPELVLLQQRTEWVGVPIRGRTDSLSHKRVVVLGTGTIGRAVCRMLSGFDCAIQTLARTDPQANLHSADELIAVLPQTDILVNCLPGTAAGFVSAPVIAAMQPGSLYANVGRGNTTDEPALIAALQTRHLGGAVLDVTAQEPLPADSPLWQMPNVLLTQHSGGGQPNEEGGKVAQFLRNLEHVRQGRSVENPVDLGRGY